MATGAPASTIVAVDANVLINLTHVGRLPLLGALPGYDFVVSDQVYLEVANPPQRAALDAAIAQGHVRRVSLTDPAGQAVYGQLTRIIGRGEAESLALAAHHGWSLFSDEKRIFLREATARLGAARLGTTVSLYLAFIQTGLLTIADADADKAVLAQNRFALSFASFADLIP